MMRLEPSLFPLDKDMPASKLPFDPMLSFLNCFLSGLLPPVGLNTLNLFSTAVDVNGFWVPPRKEPW